MRRRATTARCGWPRRSRPARIRHIPAVLVHRQAPDGAGPADAAAVARHLARRGAAGARVEANPRLPGTLRVRWPVPQPAPLVSVIVPTRDRAALLASCAAGVLHRTDYPALELLIVDNDSREAETHALFAQLAADPRVRVLRRPGPFNYAALNNDAAVAARGAVLLLLNNDVDVIHADWLAELVGHAVRPEVGAVGARLLFADGRVQHAGVALGVSGVAGHTDLLAPRSATGYGGRLALAHEVAAVTGACLAIRREVYAAVGGMDATHLAVAYNDVDLCLRVRERGLRVLWTPFAELFHLESASRPSDFARRSATAMGARSPTCTGAGVRRCRPTRSTARISRCATATHSWRRRGGGVRGRTAPLRSRRADAGAGGGGAGGVVNAAMQHALLRDRSRLRLTRPRPDRHDAAFAAPEPLASWNSFANCRSTRCCWAMPCA